MTDASFDSLPHQGRLMGLDVGSKTIGLSLSDITQTIASPLKTIERVKLSKDIEALRKCIKDYDVVGFVIGLPMNMDGSSGPRCQSVRQFTKDLTEALPLPYCFQDERMSTLAVTRTMLEADLSRKRQGEVVDKMAASYILQGCLDALKYRRAKALGTPDL